jgi:hypothetical protein
VYYVDDNDDICLIPLSWTDVQSADPFVVMSAGRSRLGAAELLELVKCLKEIRGGASGLKKCK